MTREEKIAELINIRDNFNYTLAPREVFDDAIKALEQEPILDKIRAEIDCALSEEVLSDNKQQISDVGIGLEIALSIIDRLKAESEVSNNDIRGAK